MTSAVQTPPMAEYPPSLAGPCVKCRARTQRYGAGGNPLCPACEEIVEAARAAKKKAEQS